MDNYNKRRIDKRWLNEMSRPKKVNTLLSEQKLKEKQRIKAMKPSKKFHDFPTIKWLRSRVDENLIKKCVFTLLPNNGIPEIPDDEEEEDAKKRILNEFLENYCKPKDKYKNLLINPKYFFNEKTYEKVLKLKKIFIDFDDDGSRKMELDEMENLFHDNEIKEATLDDLIQLFFQRKNVSKAEQKTLYLDFYQFMQFALTKDQNFRDFMREIKKKIAENKNNQEDKDSNTQFLPMNFNLILDYFLIKGEARESKSVIDNAIKIMDKEINNKIENTYVDEKTPEEEDINSLSLEKNSKNEDEQKENEDQNEEEEKKKENDINFNTLINKFSKLFQLDHKPDIMEKESKLFSRKRGTQNKTPRTILMSKTSSIKLPSSSNVCNIEDSEFNDEDNYFTNIIYNHLNKENLLKMNKEGYEKYHSLYLAIQNTKKNLDTDNFANLNTGTSIGQTNLKRNNNFEPSKTSSRGFLLPNITRSNFNKTTNSFFQGYRSKPKKRNDYIPISLLNTLDKNKI